MRIRLLQEEDKPALSNFDCGDPDLNDFIREDAWLYRDAMFAQTWLFFDSDRILAYASMVNDRIATAQLSASKHEVLREVRQSLGKDPMKSGQIPAVKLARLAVAERGSGIGSLFVASLCQLFASYDNRTGCRLMTVDAYNQPRVLNFYFNLDFERQSAKVLDDAETVPLVLDLRRFR